MAAGDREVASPVPAGVAVVIAAYNAEATIGRAIASALAEPDVVEVIVVDDCSSDATVAAARACDDGSGRLVVERLAANGGPSVARNAAIDRARAPFVAILDADDFFLPGRFAALFAIPDWDMAADDVAFVDQTRVDAIDWAALGPRPATVRRLSAAGFVAGCITRPGGHKRELGFLKMVWRRAFLDGHGLRYATTLRLAEDFELYTRALMLGARMVVAGTCHYVAVERTGSLSDVHDERDLANFAAACRTLIARAPADRALRSALRRLERQVARKQRHRAFLTDKRQHGLVRALTARVAAPPELAAIAVDVARDKLRSTSGAGASPRAADVRYLLTP